MADKKYILGVDDEHINQIILNEMLEDIYEIECVGDGEGCLKSVKERTPDLILLDVNMLVMNGLDTCKKLREDPSTSTIPVIFVSALASAEERMAGYDAGGDDYVSKPFEEEELLQKIKLMLSHQNDKAELKKASDETMNVLMTTMTSSSELGIVIAFLRESFSCHSITELTDTVFNATTNYGLEGSLLVTALDEPEVYFSDGVERNLERDVLSHLKNKDRIFTFGKRVAFNTPSATLLIRNMPDDDGKTGRFKDHLAILMDGLDARIQGLKYELEVVTKQRELSDVVQAAKKNLEVIDQQHISLREKNAQLLSNMAQTIEESFIYLGLSEEQERALIGLVEKTESDTVSLYEEGIKTDDQFDKIMKNLTATLAET